MKLPTTICATALALLGALPLPPAAAFNPPYIWHGRGIITALAGCTQLTLTVGQEFNSNYRPRLQPASESPAGLTMIFPQSSAIFKQNDVNQTMAGNGAYIGWQIVKGVEHSAPLKGKYAFTVKNFFNGTKGFDQTTIPLVIDPGKIFDFGGVIGCTVTFRGAYTRMP